MDFIDNPALKRLATNEWTTDIPHVLAEPNLTAVRDALSRDWVFGLHLFFRGGRGPDCIAFERWEDYIGYVEASRPGDCFILWSVDRLQECHKILAEKREADEGTDELIQRAVEITSRNLEKRLEWCGGFEAYEAIALRRIRSSGKIETLLNDWDILEDLAEFLRPANPRGCRWCVVPFTEVDRPVDEDRRKYVLVDAKRPDERGAVPVSGAY